MTRSDEKFRQSVATIVGQGRRAGDVRADVDAAGFAVAFLGILRGVVLQYLLAPNSIDLTRSRNIVNHLVRRSLHP